MQNNTELKIYKLLIYITYISFALFWFYNTIFQNADSELHNIFSDTYGIIAFFGGITGLYVAKKWGGFKSLLGKSLTFFALGMFAQFFGQLVYSFYYFFLKIDAAYPSVGDIGFFGSIPLYIMGLFYLARVSGVSFTLHNIKKKPIYAVLAVIIPTILLIVSYMFFLKDYEMDYGAMLTVILDFGYPLGQALYLAIALLIAILSADYLGGILKVNIWYLLFALSVQYLADFVFLYRNSRDMWMAGGISDFIYLTAYFIMALALIKIAEVPDKIKSSNSSRTN